MTEDKNITWHQASVTRADKERIKNHKSCILWFTGLSASGKSTVAHKLEHILNRRNIHTYVLDGDNVRHGLNKDLGFTKEDREENIRRIGEVAKLFVDAGILTITAFISPFRKDRNEVRHLMDNKGDFVEIYVRCSVDTCIERDPKGLYKKALAGEIPNFTGISQDYEEPENPEILVDTDESSVDECAKTILEYLEKNEIIKAEGENNE